MTFFAGRTTLTLVRIVDRHATQAVGVSL
jgi:hypothetical protein